MVKVSSYNPWIFWRVAGLSATIVLFQITLTRLFSVSQFYHFAFLIISMAMLGYAVSGVILAFLRHIHPQRAFNFFGWLSFGCAFSFFAAYLSLNYLPFDSFSIIWDPRQVFLFAFNYVMLTIPFTLGGLAIGILLETLPSQTESFYAMNFIGAGLGSLAGLGLPVLVGGEGAVLFCCLLAGLCAFPLSEITLRVKFHKFRLHHAFNTILLIFLMGNAAELVLRSQASSWLQFLNLRISPYKGLSYTLQYPDAKILSQRWNAFSRIDVVRSANIRSLPGLSIQYQQLPPPQDGLFIDGDDLSPIVRDTSDLGFTAFLPTALAFQLRPHAKVLIVEPNGGLDILVAIGQGASQVIAVENNPLIVQAAYPIYHLPNVQISTEDQRSYFYKSTEKYDVILLSLSSTFHPVRSGAYSLAEDYRTTLESFHDLLLHLKPNGILIFNRWLQKPPSESLRAFALAVTALEQMGLSPAERLIALRSYAMATILVKLEPFSMAELNTIHQFAGARSLDFISSPDLSLADVNRYNVLTQPVYTQTFQAILDRNTRSAFYHSYPYDVRPPTDDHPFFAHYFKWSQIPQALTELGKTWQPFGGAGLLAVVGLLLFVLILGGGLVGITFWKSQIRQLGQPLTKLSMDMVLYFAAIGFGYMLIELPLIQRFQLYLIHPAYSLAIVLFTLLISSGIGSNLSKKVRLDRALLLLSIWWMLASFGLKPFFQTTLGCPLTIRAGLMAAVVAPGGFLMGCAFPGGIYFYSIKPRGENQLPLIWAINGAASVVASITAMLLALTWGFNSVLRLGALCYGCAFITVWLKGKWIGSRQLTAQI